MKRTLVLVVALVMLSSCASVADIEVVKLLNEACTLYTENREDVVKLRQYAIDNQPAIPPKIWEALVTIDREALPVLDKLGKASCDYAAIARGVSRPDAQRWRDAINLAVQAASLAKQAGII
jgi:hypothetical protein